MEVVSPFLVEHMLLLTVLVQDGEAVRCQCGRGLNPLSTVDCGICSSSGAKTRPWWCRTWQIRHYALKASGNILVARIHIALQLRVAVHLVLQHADLIEGLVRPQTACAPFLSVPLRAAKASIWGLQRLHGRNPTPPSSDRSRPRSSGTGWQFRRALRGGLEGAGRPGRAVRQQQRNSRSGQGGENGLSSRSLFVVKR